MTPSPNNKTESSKKNTPTRNESLSLLPRGAPYGPRENHPFESYVVSQSPGRPWRRASTSPCRPPPSSRRRLAALRAEGVLLSYCSSGENNQWHENLSGVNLSLAEHHQNTCKLQMGPSRVKSMSFAGMSMVFCRCFACVLMALCALILFC